MKRLLATVLLLVSAILARLTVPGFAGNIPSEEQAVEEMSRCESLTASAGALVYWKCARLQFLTRSGGSTIGVQFVNAGDQLAILVEEGQITDSEFMQRLKTLMDINNSGRAPPLKPASSSSECDPHVNPQPPECWTRLQEHATREVIRQTKAFVTIAIVSCPHPTYVEWEGSIKEMVSLWSLVVAQETVSPRPFFFDIKQTLELDILESRFAVADSALHNGGRQCLNYADVEFRRILQDFRNPAFAFARDRAKVGIEDVREKRKN